MKRIVNKRNVTFDASAKTITFTEYALIYKENILLITNVTDGIDIYDFGDQTNLGGTVSTNVLSLTYNTTTMDDTDDLLIFYDDARNNSRVIDDWTATAQNTITAGTSFILKGKTLLHIQSFLDTETAHTGTRFVVQASSMESGNEDWYDYTEFVGNIGTANSEQITDNPLAAASTTISCASTTGYTTFGVWRAIKDGTLANSELIYQKGYTNNTNITILDGTTNSHVLNTLMYNVALSQVVLVDSSVVRVRVNIDNTYDSDGSSTVTRVTASW